MWKLKVPPKVNAFLWYGLQGILPSKVNLRRKGVIMNVTCSAYGGEEDEFHVLGVLLLENVWRILEFN